MTTLPNIFVSFRQLANTFIQRSQRGNVILIIKDGTDKTFSLKHYRDLKEFDAEKEKYTEENRLYIKDSFIGAPANVYVLRIDDDSTLTSDNLDTLKGLETGWIGGHEILKTETDVLTEWIKGEREEHYTFKAVITDPTNAPNDKGIVELNKDMIAVFKDDRNSKTAKDIIPTILSLLAGANVEKGTTYLPLNNLKSVINTASSQEDIEAGKMPIIMDENTVKIGLGINSLTEFKDKVDDERYIEIVEVQDLINDDLTKTFKMYIGRKNSLDTQMIVISATNNYFKELSVDEILDPNFNNKSSIDVNSQRDEWIKINPDAREWDDTKVINNVYKNKMFLNANVKILFAVKDIQLNITMNN